MKSAVFRAFFKRKSAVSTSVPISVPLPISLPISVPFSLPISVPVPASLNPSKTAVFLIMPEEDPARYFLVSLILQQLFREIRSITDEMGGALKKRVMFCLDEFGTFTKIEGMDKMFPAIRSRGVYLVPVIQGSAQLETNYGREGADNINNNCQMTMFSEFSLQSKDADGLSKALGNRTIMTGFVSSSRWAAIPAGHCR
ncbi:MAG: TraM recognition domain-containing protein [Solobacterium sp.]|nr:TraM recognition domain-containing protein [Solobacterium sp.]